MTAAMQRLADDFVDIGAETEAGSGGERRLAFAVEGPVNEFFIPYFQICDIRGSRQDTPSRPTHTGATSCRCTTTSITSIF